ncbi:nicotinic acetylcholine receptor delta [Sarotherodon galilaeus]
MRMLLFTTGATGHDAWSSGESGQPLWIVTGHSTLFSTESGVRSLLKFEVHGENTCEELEVGVVVFLPRASRSPGGGTVEAFGPTAPPAASCAARAEVNAKESLSHYINPTSPTPPQGNTSQ